MIDGLQGRSYLGGLDCLGTVWSVKVGGLCEFRMTGGLVLGAGKRKGSGLTTGILKEEGRKVWYVQIYHTDVRSLEFFQILYRRTRRKPSSSVQFENENDVTPRVINVNRPHFPIF